PLTDGAGLAVVLGAQRGDLRQWAALVEQHRHPARIHGQSASGGAAQRPEPRPGHLAPLVVRPAEPRLVGVAATVASAVFGGLATRIVVLATLVAAVSVVGEPLPWVTAGPGRTVVVVVLVVVVLHGSHAEVGLDLVQCAHRLTLLQLWGLRFLGVGVSVMKM